MGRKRFQVTGNRIKRIPHVKKVRCSYRIGAHDRQIDRRRAGQFASTSTPPRRPGPPGDAALDTTGARSGARAREVLKLPPTTLPDRIGSSAAKERLQIDNTRKAVEMPSISELSNTRIKLL